MRGALAGPWRWAAAERRRRWRSTVVLALLVGLGGGAVLGALAGARRTESAFDRFRAAAEAADVQVQISEGERVAGLGPAGRRALDAVARLPEVERLDAVELFIGSNGASEYDVGVVAGPDPGLGGLGRPRIVDGRLPDPSSAAEVVTNEVTAAEAGLEVGDRFTISTFTLEQLAAIEDDFTGFGGPQLDLELVGIVRTPEDLTGENAGSFAATAAFHEANLGRAGSFGGVARVRLAPGVDAAAGTERIRSTLEASGGLQEVSVESLEDQAAQVSSATAVLGDGLRLFALAAGLAGAVAAGQALSRRLGETAADQVVLDALGCTRPQRAVAAVLAVAPAALGGGVLAGLVALAASPLHPIGVGRRAEPSPGFDADLLVLGAGVPLVALAALLLAAAAATRVSAVPRLGTKIAAGRLRRSTAATTSARLGAPAPAVLGVSLALEPGRGATAVPVRPALVGAVLGTAGIVAATTFGASLDRLVDTPADYGWSFDVAPEVFEEQYDALLDDEDVADLGRVHLARLLLGGQEVQGMAVEALKGAPGLRLLDGRPPAGPGEAAVGSADLDRLGVSLGDRVSLAGPSGPVEVEVVGTASFPLLDGNRFDSGALLSPGQLAEVQRSGGFDQAVVTWRDDVDPAAAEARLEALLPGSLPVYAFPTRPGSVQNLAGVSSLPPVLAGFLVVVALAAIGHALVAGVRRRRRDLAVVRVLGFVRRQVATTVAWQSTTLAVVGLGLGIPLGVAAGRLVWGVVAGGVGVPPAPVVPAGLVAALVPATVLAALAFASYPARTAARLRPADGLRVE